MKADPGWSYAGTMRAILAALFVLGALGTTVELLLLGHVESWRQALPFAALGLGLAAFVWAGARPGPASLRTLQGVMLGVVATGALGVGLHYGSNLEFEREMDPAAAGVALMRETLTGAIPVLAPAFMAQLGLIGLAFTYRHPGWRRDTDHHPPTGAGAS